MSNDDKTIITFRRDGASINGAGASGGAVPGGGFQRPMPGGRGVKSEPHSAVQPIRGVPPATSKPAMETCSAVG